jgi:hypothetical protein
MMVVSWTPTKAPAIIAAFNHARAAGHLFDPFTVALVEVLRRQIAETFEGFEDDLSVDDGFEDDREPRKTTTRTFAFGPRPRSVTTSAAVVPAAPSTR